jgi:hypothetical protein
MAFPMTRYAATRSLPVRLVLVGGLALALAACGGGRDRPDARVAAASVTAHRSQFLPLAGQPGDAVVHAADAG